MNQEPWLPLKDVLNSIKDVFNSESWMWTRNVRCKYVHIKIDMRNGRAILLDRDGNRISKQNLLRQYPEAFKEESE